MKIDVRSIAGQGDFYLGILDTYLRPTLLRNFLTENFSNAKVFRAHVNDPTKWTDDKLEEVDFLSGMELLTAEPIKLEKKDTSNKDKEDRSRTYIKFDTGTEFVPDTHTTKVVAREVWGEPYHGGTSTWHQSVEGKILLKELAGVELVKDDRGKRDILREIPMPNTDLGGGYSMRISYHTSCYVPREGREFNPVRRMSYRISIRGSNPGPISSAFLQHLNDAIFNERRKNQFGTEYRFLKKEVNGIVV